MSFAIELRDSVVDDVLSARAWYENERAGLGDGFLTAFYASLPHVQRNPLVFAKYYRDVRHYVLKRFPYGVYFRIEDQTIVVYRVNHAARSQARLRKSMRDLGS